MSPYGITKPQGVNNTDKEAGILHDLAASEEKICGLQAIISERWKIKGERLI